MLVFLAVMWWMALAMLLRKIAPIWSAQCLARGLASGSELSGWSVVLHQFVGGHNLSGSVWEPMMVHIVNCEIIKLGSPCTIVPCPCGCDGMRVFDPEAAQLPKEPSQKAER